MDLIIFPLLQSNTRKSILRTKRQYGAKWGHPYYYEPNGTLITRLSVQLSMTKAEVRARLIEEREYLINQQSKQ